MALWLLVMLFEIIFWITSHGLGLKVNDYGIFNYFMFLG